MNFRSDRSCIQSTSSIGTLPHKRPSSASPVGKFDFLHSPLSVSSSPVRGSPPTVGVRLPPPASVHRTVGELCTSFCKSLTDAGSAELLTDRFCFVLLQLFGKNNRINMLQTNSVVSPYDSDALYDMLRFRGPVLNSADQLLRGLWTSFQLTIDRSTGDLIDVRPCHWTPTAGDMPSPTQPAGADLRLTGLSSFEVYFFLFFWHASRAQLKDVVDQRVSNVYLVLLNEYLDQFLEVKGQFFNWSLANSCRKFFKNIRSFDASPVSPYGLLSTSFYAADTDRQGSVGGGGKSGQSELTWKASVFFNLVCDVWLSGLSDVQAVSGVHSGRPVFDMCVIVVLMQSVLRKLYRSAFGMARRSVAASMDETLHRSCEPFEAVVIEKIFRFIRSIFQSWPNDVSFKYLFDLWLIAIQPWLCDGTSVYTDRWSWFVLKNRDLYKQLFLVTLKHFASLKMTKASSVDMLYRTCEIYNQSLLLSALQEHEKRALMNSSMSTSPGDPEQFFYDDVVQLTVRTLLFNIIRAKVDLETRLHAYRLSRQSRSWWQVLVDFFDVQVEADEYGLRQLLDRLAFCERSLSSLFSMDLAELSRLADDKLASSTSFDNLPDSYLDDHGRLRLSPVGQCQVLDRTHSYPIQRYQLAPGDQLPLRSDESAALFRLQQFASDFLNRTFADHFDRAYRRPDMLGRLARRLLLAPSDEAMRNTPVMSRQVVHLPPRVSLRPLASPKFLLFLLACLLISASLVGHSLDIYVVVYIAVIGCCVCLLCNL